MSRGRMFRGGRVKVEVTFVRTELVDVAEIDSFKGHHRKAQYVENARVEPV